MVLAAVMSISAFADTIRLKDGSIIKGKITAFGQGSFTVVIGEGQRRRELVFSAADIESIEFDIEPADSAGQSAPYQQTSSNSDRKLPPKVIISDGISTIPSNSQKPKPPAVADAGEKQYEKLPAKPAEKPVSKQAGFKPVELSVKVLADNSSNGWTNSGWVVKKGQKIKITGGGEISLGGGKTSPPDGLFDLEDPSKLLKGVPTGALIAVIGDDNNDFIYIGSGREFVAERDGALFLGVNEGNLNDNNGSFDVKVEIAPGTE